MTTQSTNTTTIQAQAPDLNDLDLDPIKAKLSDPKHGEGWSHNKIEAVATQYRRFLTIVRDNPDTTIVPTEAIDEFWHTHILDTMKYTEDCNRYFGFYLHHFPYLGLRGEDDVKRLADAFDTTQKLYEARFGESLLPTGGVLSEDSCSAGCGGVVCSVGTCTAEQRPQYRPQMAA